MKVVCAYCGKKMGDKPPFDDHRISHGACPKCEEEQNQILSDMIEKRKRIEKYLLDIGKEPLE